MSTNTGSGGSSRDRGRGQQMLDRLRSEAFNVVTEEKLASHPYVQSAEKGELTMRQRRAFVEEQYAVQHSDAISFAVLAGHEGFVPPSLSGAVVPEPVRKPPSEGEADDLFQFLLGGEIYASKLLLQCAEKLGLDEIHLRNYQTMPLAQAYPSYWARLALSGSRAAGAAACAVNFPAWGQMCKRLVGALGKPDSVYGYSGVDDPALAFISFFSTPIDNLDEMTAAIIEEEGVSYDELLEPVRLLQQYEVLFWDSINNAVEKP
ncbi:hypothetical protein ACHAWF_003260 [Thalassiosira exigua]